MSFLTWRWDFPQKLQRSCSFESVGRAKRSPLSMARPGASTQITTHGPLARPCFLLGRGGRPFKRATTCMLSSGAGDERVTAPCPDRVARAAVGGALVVQVDRVAGDRVVEHEVVIRRRTDVHSEVAVVPHAVVPEPHAIAVVDEDPRVRVGFAGDRVVVHAVVGDLDASVEAGVLDDDPLVVPVRGVAHDPQRAAPGICDATDVDAGVAEPAWLTSVGPLSKTLIPYSAPSAPQVSRTMTSCTVPVATNSKSTSEGKGPEGFSAAPTTFR